MDTGRERALQGVEKHDPTDKFRTNLWSGYRSSAICEHPHGHLWSFDYHCSMMNLEFWAAIKQINESR